MDDSDSECQEIFGHGEDSLILGQNKGGGCEEVQEKRVVKMDVVRVFG